MTFGQWIEVLTILSTYHKNGLDSYAYMRAEHDEIFLPADNSDKFSEEDYQRLIELGCRRNDVDGLSVFV